MYKSKYFVLLSLSILITSFVILFGYPKVTTETKTIVIVDDYLLAKNLETYSCGSKNRDTCASYIFTFSSKSVEVNRHTYYSTNLDEKVKLTKTIEALKPLAFFVLASIILNFLFLVNKLISKLVE